MLDQCTSGSQSWPSTVWMRLVQASVSWPMLGCEQFAMTDFFGAVWNSVDCACVQLWPGLFELLHVALGKFKLVNMKQLGMSYFRARQCQLVRFDPAASSDMQLSC